MERSRIQQPDHGKLPRTSTPLLHAATLSAEAMPASTPLLHHRVIYCDMEPCDVSTRKTIASLLLGEGSSTEEYLFHMGIKNRYAQGVLWGMWSVGAIAGLLAVAAAVPVGFVWASLLMLPLPVVTVMLLSVDLVKQLAASMDLYIIYILQFALFVDGIYYCRADLRRIFWYCLMPSLFASGLVDAYPAKYRAQFATLYFSSSLCILAVWNVLLVFKWEVFGSSAKLVNISFTLHHLSDQLTLAVFYGRHLFCSILWPDYFVLIKADVRTGLRSAYRKDTMESVSPSEENWPATVLGKRRNSDPGLARVVGEVGDIPTLANNRAWLSSASFFHIGTPRPPTPPTSPRRSPGSVEV